MEHIRVNYPVRELEHSSPAPQGPRVSTGKILTDFWSNIFISQRRKPRPNRENDCLKVTKFKALLLLCRLGNAMPPAQNTSLRAVTTVPGEQRAQGT